MFISLTLSLSFLSWLPIYYISFFFIPYCVPRPMYVTSLPSRSFLCLSRMTFPSCSRLQVAEAAHFITQGSYSSLVWLAVSQWEAMGADFLACKFPFPAYIDPLLFHKQFWGRCKTPRAVRKIWSQAKWNSEPAAAIYPTRKAFALPDAASSWFLAWLTIGPLR
jgi:hypothetical protein